MGTPPADSLTRHIQRMHRSWADNLRAAVQQVRTKDDVWPRWHAIRYVDTVFGGRFERERRIVEALGSAIGENRATRLWIAGELISLLRWQLQHAVGLCHHDAEYSAITASLLRAVEHWFAEVEEAMASVSWEDVPDGIVQELSLLEADTAPALRPG
jgi:hypothetical protein